METDFLSKLSAELGNLALSNLTGYMVTLAKNIVLAIIIYFTGKFVIGKVLSIVRRIMQRRKVEPSLYSFLNSLLNIALYFVLVIAIVSVLGIETSSLVALFASAGVAVGMALSGTLQNFAGGVMILIFRPYRVGDFIEAQGYSGTVREIQIFSTVMTTADNQTIIIPNGGLSTGTIKNSTKATRRRVDIDVEVAYGTRPDDVRRVLAAICQSEPRLLQGTENTAAMPMTSMSASSIVFSLRVWVKPENYWPVKFDLTERIYNDLTAAGIEIPYQQIDVHMK
jgi:small conductance mechanosensitive channel